MYIVPIVSIMTPFIIIIGIHHITIIDIIIATIMDIGVVTAIILTIIMDIDTWFQTMLTSNQNQHIQENINQPILYLEHLHVRHIIMM
jgi:hypothetical protein